VSNAFGARSRKRKMHEPVPISALRAGLHFLMSEIAHPDCICLSLTRWRSTSSPHKEPGGGEAARDLASQANHPGKYQPEHFLSLSGPKKRTELTGPSR